jgi:hemoglobin
MNKLFKAGAATSMALMLLASISAYAQNAGNDTAFRALGGKEGIQKIINVFLPIAAADRRINSAFIHTDIGRMSAMLTDQFCALLNGPCAYSGRDMRTVHADMAITNAQFNAMAEDLQEAMRQLHIPFSAQNKLLAKLAPMQRVIVTK